MPTPRPVSKKLREMLGTEAAETMVEWLDGLDERQDTLRREMRAEFAAVRQEMTVVRQEMVALRTELSAELRVGVAELREEMRAGFAAVDAKIAQRNANLMKWMIGFWLASFGGSITAIFAFGHTRP